MVIFRSFWSKLPQIIAKYMYQCFVVHEILIEH